MSSSDLIRWGGLAAMLAGVAFIVLMLIPEGPPGSFLLYVLNSLVFIVAVLLLLVGVAGFHALQKENYGRIGRGGLYTVVVAGITLTLARVGLMSESPSLGFLNFLGLLGVMVGFVLYGAATLQARVLPRWCGVGFIVGWPVTVALGDLGNGLFGLLWLAMGYVLWSRRGAATEQPSRVR